MRCSSYCSANAFNLKYNNFKALAKHGYAHEFIDKVLYAKYVDEKEGIVDIFVFHFGCVIIWGASEALEAKIVKDINRLSANSSHEIYSEFINFNYNKKSDRTYIDEEKNIVYLASDDPYIKLSISHALAQSVKLNELEERVMDLLTKSEPIQQELASKGMVAMSKSEISKQIGTLFSTRYSVNMHRDILDTPEFFWRRPSFEPIYDMTVEFQDIQIRQGILNNHLNLIHELYSLLASDLNHKSSTRLEIIIVLLIAIEVFVALSNENLFSKILNLFGINN